MEKFTIDLDRILDDFELQEDRENIDNYLSKIQTPVNAKPSAESYRSNSSRCEDEREVALLAKEDSLQKPSIDAIQELPLVLQNGFARAPSSCEKEIILEEDKTAEKIDKTAVVPSINPEINGHETKLDSGGPDSFVQDLVSFNDEPFEVNLPCERNHLSLSNLDLLTGIDLFHDIQPAAVELNVPIGIVENLDRIPESDLQQSCEIAELPSVNRRILDNSAIICEKNEQSFDVVSSVDAECHTDIQEQAETVVSAEVTREIIIKETNVSAEVTQEIVIKETNVSAENHDNERTQSNTVRFGDFIPDVTEDDLEDLLDELEKEETFSVQEDIGQQQAVNLIPGDKITSSMSAESVDFENKQLSFLPGDVETSKAKISVRREIQIEDQNGSSMNANPPNLTDIEDELVLKDNNSKDAEAIDLIQSISGTVPDQVIVPEHAVVSEQEPTPVTFTRQESEPDIIGRNDIAMQPDIVDIVDVEPDVVQNVEPGEPVVVRSNSPRPCDLILGDGDDVVLGSPGTTPHSGVDPQFFVDDHAPMTEDQNSLETTPFVPEPYTSLTEEEKILGIIKPFWIPDLDALACMHCDTRFTLIKRRHHCRTCGKVFCSLCCNMRSKIEYLENKEERVCQPCFAVLSKVEAYKKYGSPLSPSGSSEERRPNPNNPSEYCSTVPPLQQSGSSSRVPPTVMVPVGVLKREGSIAKPRTEQKQVMFSDGIRPGGDLTALDEGQQTTVRPSKRPTKAKKSAAANAITKSNRSVLPTSFLPKNDDLPPVLQHELDCPGSELKFEENIAAPTLLARLKDENELPVKFVLNRNFVVDVKMVNLDCCVNKICWSFTTEGLRTVGQDELMVLLETTPDETTVPKDIFVHLNNIYEQAAKGTVQHDLSYTEFDSPFLGSKDISGFLYIRPTFQCMKKLNCPSAPFLFCLLIQRTEMPWAKVFPLRLMLRLGAEFRYYPCPLYSSRERGPVFREIGSTIVNLLADFRNFTYTLPVIKGLTIHIEDKQTMVSIPKSYHSQLVRAVGQSNENVLAFGASFNLKADSHLVCIQQAEGSYQTQAINIHNRPRSATGANFIVFNGALKTTSGLSGKSSIVEDGVMVQILPDSMVALRTALKDMKDFQVNCGPVSDTPMEETISLKWTDECSVVNMSVSSPIDCRSMSGVPSVRVYSGMELQCGTKAIRWNELYFIKISAFPANQNSETRLRPEDVPELSKCCESVAKAVCNALVSHLESLKENNLSPLAVRLTLEAEQAEYEAGSSGQRLPTVYTNDLDTHLIPVVLNESAKFTNGPCVVELWFYIVDKL